MPNIHAAIYFIHRSTRNLDKRLTPLAHTGLVNIVEEHRGRIINGEDIDSISNRPYQLYLASLKTKGWHLCGAVLIAPNWALTAGHCVTDYVNGTIYKSSESKLSAGSPYRSNFTNNNIKTIPQKDIIIHPIMMVWGS